MSLQLNINLDTYLHLHADCIPVKGATRFVICDLTRNELLFFPSEYYEVLEYLRSDKIGFLLKDIISEEEKTLVVEFIEFLNQHEFISFLHDPSLFPAIEEKWDIPAIIQNAIIDVDITYHDFDKIFQELDELGCQFVQIRSFSDILSLDGLYQVLSSAHHKSIQSIELILKYNAHISDEAYIKLIEDHPIIAGLTIHSSPEKRTLIVDYGCDIESIRYVDKHIHLVTQQITSQAHCGIINVKSLNAPTVNNFFETKLFNGCLNRKVSVDTNGEIKNCPSMLTSYGNIKDTSLSEAINNYGFTDTWKITKDQIAVCKDCEFRYVCSDCRAYVENPEDIFSKPLKCGYNPYTCEWEEWSQNPLKQKAIAFYYLNDSIMDQNRTKVTSALSA
ncbi:grasp-with-spasm system SPASM domain peptide maturase [Adhaeribacter radiodurans]|uniref:Grasp-with-spasm system SPASM domain peptide maturase n=1 Tax=Adhaeribacter radiodurans TaxID=2745197 RepID=A0A7L7L5Y9_9BACT|nr:grasp-with-spasm system SPASM domain peptide maturase [Adhaeribacter radiodurans]QMU28193.1 grasp-with-spasm system SPASM domain peptide maturase [Adhaeribacter radiodurans]